MIYWWIRHSRNILGQHDSLTEPCHSPSTMGTQLLSEGGLGWHPPLQLLSMTLSPLSSQRLLFTWFSGFPNGGRRAGGTTVSPKAFGQYVFGQYILAYMSAPTPLGQPTPRKSPLILNGRCRFKFPLFCHLFHLLCEVLLVKDKFGCVGTDMSTDPLLIFVLSLFFGKKKKNQNQTKHQHFLWVRWDGLCG